MSDGLCLLCAGGWVMGLLVIALFLAGANRKPTPSYTASGHPDRSAVGLVYIMVKFEDVKVGQ